VHCNKNGAVCDEMERLTGTFTYPISVIIEKKPIEKNGFTVYKEISTIVYFANNYSSFTPTKKLADDRVAIQVLSLTDMYNILKQS